MTVGINFNYTQGVKRAVVSTLEPMMKDPNFPIPELTGNVTVGLEYPLTKASYPAIFITFQESQLRNVGVGNEELVIQADGTPTRVKHWYFIGTINFNILALSPMERDELGSVLINILAFGDTNSWLGRFQKNLMDASYIEVQYLKDIIHPGGEQIGTVPWESTTEMSFGVNYSIDIFGEFYSDPWTGDLIQVEHVELYPYLPGTTPPLGDI